MRLCRQSSQLRLLRSRRFFQQRIDEAQCFSDRSLRAPTDLAVSGSSAMFTKIALKLWETVHQAHEDIQVEGKELKCDSYASRFVACAVFAVGPECSCLAMRAPVCNCPVRASPAAFGVNHALHRYVNRNARSDANDTLLPGILKGCAEQNALGALAAQGIPYHHVRSLVIVGSNLTTGVRQIDSRSLMLPCGVCQQYFLKIQRMNTAVFPKQPPLSLLAVSDFDTTKHSRHVDTIDGALDLRILHIRELLNSR